VKIPKFAKWKVLEKGLLNSSALSDFPGVYLIACFSICPNKPLSINTAVPLTFTAVPTD
jgi:hypothetical protein